MLKSVEEISATKKKLKIEIPADVVENEIQRILREIQKRVSIPGFRPGKAPLSIIEKKFGKDAESEALEKLVSSSFDSAIKEAKIKPLLPPISEDAIDIKRKESLSFELIVETRPENIELKYEDLEIEELPLEVTDEEIEETIKRLSVEKGVYEPVDENIDNEDLVILDLKTDDGRQFSNFIYKVGSGPYPKAFSEALIGKRKGDSFSITVDFPEDSVSDFAGKKVTFDVTVKEIKRRKEIPLEELPKELGFESLEEVREEIKKQLEKIKREQNELRYKAEILSKLLDSHDFELPEGVLELELRRLTEEYEKMNLNVTEMMDKILEQAKRNVKSFILLDVIGEKEGVSVSDDELKGEIINLSKRYFLHPKEVVNYYVSRDGSLEGVRRSIYEKKVLEVLLKKAKMVKKEQSSHKEESQ